MMSVDAPHMMKVTCAPGLKMRKDVSFYSMWKALGSELAMIDTRLASQQSSRKDW